MIPGIAPVVLRFLPGNPLVEYYGTGAGNIIIDWDFSDAATVTKDASDVISAVVNKGGTGSTYNLGSSLGVSLKYGSGGFALANGAKSGLKLATSLQLKGLHLLVVVRGAQATVTAAGYDNPKWMVGSVSQYSRSQNTVVCTGVNKMQIGALPPDGDSGYGRYEMRLSDSEVGQYTVNAMQTGSPTSTPSFTTAYLGATHDQGTPVAAIRRMIIVKQASGYDATSPEPAVLAARALLQADADTLNGV